MPDIQLKSLTELAVPLDRRASRSKALSTRVFWTGQHHPQPGVDSRQQQRLHQVQPAARDELRGQSAGKCRQEHDNHAGLLPGRVTTAPAAAQDDWTAAPRQLGQFYSSGQLLGLAHGQHSDAVPSLLHELRQLQQRPVSPAPLRADRTQLVPDWSIVRQLDNSQQPRLQVASNLRPESMPLDITLPELGSLVEPEAAAATLRHSDLWGASAALPLPQECLPLQFDSFELPAADYQAAGLPQQQNFDLRDQGLGDLRQQPSDAPSAHSCHPHQQLADMLPQPRLHSPAQSPGLAANLQRKGSMHAESAGTVMELEFRRNIAANESQVNLTAALAPVARAGGPADARAWVTHLRLSNAQPNMKLGLQGTEIKVEDQDAEEQEARRRSDRLRSKRQCDQSPGADPAAEAAAAHVTADECQAQFSRLASQHLLVSHGFL